MNKKIALIMCTIIIFLFSACSFSKENVNKEVEGNKKETVKIKKPIGKNKKDEPKKENRDVEKKKISKEENSKEELKQKVIVIDPGHANRSNLQLERISPDGEEKKIKDGGGAEGVNSKTPEYVIVMDVAMKLKESLEREGYTIIMTKTQHSESLGNIERAEVGNKNNANLVIRIHADSAERSDVTGASVLVPAKKGYAIKISDISKKYAQIILNEMVASANMNNRGVVESADMTGFNWSKVPVVLVEMGFLSNATEDKLLNSYDYRTKLVEGLTNGIKKALN